MRRSTTAKRPVVLRAIEKGARETRNVEPGDAAYLTLMARLLQRKQCRRAAAASRTAFVDHSLTINYNLSFAPGPPGRIYAGLSRGNHGQAVCNLRKGPVVGRTISHAHNVGPRRFEPNLQSVRALINGATKRIRVCTRCLRSGKVTKAA